MTKADLKSGDIVEIRNGDLYLVCEDALIDDEGWLDLNDYDNSLCIVNGKDKWDIMKVYRDMPKGHIFDIVTHNAIPYVYKCCKRWERPQVVEMTVAEIEEKLGIKNLKIVKEKEKEEYVF